MQCKLTQLANLAVSKVFSLTPGTVERDHDLAQKEPPRGELIAIRKRKYIGRSVIAEEPLVQLTNRRVASENEMNLGVIDIEAAQTADNNSPQLLSRGSRRFSLPPYVDSSRQCASSC